MRFAGLVLTAALAATAVEAKTITLLDGEGVTVFDYDFVSDTVSLVEDGFSYGNSGSYSGSEIDLHDDFGGLRTTTLQRVDGKAFSVKSLQVDLYSRIYSASTDAAEAPFFDYATPLDLLQATVTFLGEGGSLGSYDLYSVKKPSLWLSGLSNVTQVIFSYFVPKSYATYFEGEGASPGEEFCNEWCGDLIVSELVVDAPGLASVPLPASGLLLAGALAAGAAGLRRRRSD
ncbi:MAG: hypothetical protein DI533_00585 [Cereibacter sphaeroides]|uniref:VPLPA-CTERM sorting domain-containing protein n=1 Tax=Cereibacter sphaeroides TaxID=1063 RepID=A0A2W5TTF1_CERSP|nr:MAG: hypothetical protein DI533_00585 [Cereibacter sphaeroides]